MKRARLLLIALIATLAGSTACGGGGYTQAAKLSDRRSSPAVTPGGTTSVADHAPPRLKRKRRPVPDPTETRLSNGVRVLFYEQHDFPAASLGFVLDRGASAAPPEVAELYANAIPIGSTKNESSKDATGELAWLGAHMGARAWQDAVSVSVTTLSVLLPQVLPRVCAMATTPTFDDDSLTFARANAKRSAHAYREDPSTMSDVALRSLLFPDRHPYGLVAVAGNATRFEQMSKNELENFRDMYVAADRLTVIASGDIKPAELIPRLERCLAHVTRKKGADAPPIPAAITPNKARIVLVPRANASQANISLGFIGVRRGDPRAASLAVLESILGRSLSGRMNLNIRAEHGYSYGVRMATHSWREGGMIAVNTSADTAHAADTVKGLLAELQRIQNEPIEAAELERAKLHAASGLLVVDNSASGFGLLQSLAIYGLPLGHFEQLALRIEATTEADVQAAATKSFTTGSVQIAVVGDPSLADSLRALGIGEVTVRRE